MTEPPSHWRRLSPRMLAVHPVHEMARQLPVLIGSVVLGSATGNALWPALALTLAVAVGLLRWLFTSYRIDDENVSLRTGMLSRREVSVPRNRIRSVQTEARLLHRLAGVTALRVGTGQQAHGDAVIELDAVPSAAVPRLRAVLLAESLAPVRFAREPGRVLARWQPSWLRYAPLSLSGLVMIGAVVGVAYQAGLGLRLQGSSIARSGLQAAERTGVALVIAVGAVGLLVLSLVLAVLFSWLTYGNLLLRRDGSETGGVLQLRHGLLRVRERTYDLRRLRGATIREPLLVRALGGARLDAVMTGVHGEGESSVLLPPCPLGTVDAVATELIENRQAVSGPLRAHGPAAMRRRWARALAAPVLAGFALAVLAVLVPVSGWLWLVWVALAAGCAGLAWDRSRSLGHRVGDGWLVARAGSLHRRRDCIDTAGIVGWTVRQTWPQRRVGVATLIAATAAGRKGYRVIDVPAELAWPVAAAASPWVGHSAWARPAQ